MKYAVFEIISASLHRHSIGCIRYQVTWRQPGSLDFWSHDGVSNLHVTITWIPVFLPSPSRLHEINRQVKPERVIKTLVQRDSPLTARRALPVINHVTTRFTSARNGAAEHFGKAFRILVWSVCPDAALYIEESGDQWRVKIDPGIKWYIYLEASELEGRVLDINDKRYGTMLDEYFSIFLCTAWDLYNVRKS